MGSRLTRLGFGCWSVLLCSSMFGCDDAGIGAAVEEAPRGIAAPVEAPHTSAEPAVTLPAGVDVRVTRVTDGDTVHVEYEGRDERLRYIGVNTPETEHSPRGAEPLGEEATEYNRSLVEGQTVRLVLGHEERDRYGRLLGYVYLRDGTFVNAALVDSGYARVMTVRPNDRFEQHFRQLERNARNARRGVWER